MINILVEMLIDLLATWGDAARVLAPELETSHMKVSDLLLKSLAHAIMHIRRP